MKEWEPMHSVFDGIVRIRAPGPDDAATIVDGRDDESIRWLGPGSKNPTPLACVEVGGAVVGWVDADTDPEHHWLQRGQVNLGYCLFPRFRGRGYATRALQLLMHHLALERCVDTATLLIDPQNSRSLGVAARASFTPCGEIDGQAYFTRDVPPLEYSDGVITIRRQDPELDLARHLEAIDEEQIDWLWLPGHRELWEAMTSDAKVEHQRRHLRASRDQFGLGPNWRFSVDLAEQRYVAYVDCDLANEHVPAGEANISYAAHPAHRGHGYVARAVRLVMRFLGDHTGAHFAHLVIDAENVASLRVASSLAAAEDVRWREGDGSTKVRYLIALR